MMRSLYVELFPEMVFPGNAGRLCQAQCRLPEKNLIPQVIGSRSGV